MSKHTLSAAPSLSVVMPAYNADKTLLFAIKSTLVAMPKDAEFLVLIEGEIDERHPVFRLKDERLRILRKPKPSGVAGALNFLINEARGTYLARMDADDICLPWRFRSQMREIMQGTVDFVFMNAILFGRSIKPLGLFPQLPTSLTPDQVRAFLSIANPLVHPTMLCRREVLDALGGYPNLIAEDYSMWLTAVLSGYNVRRLAGYGVLYRVHTGQLSQQQEIRLAWQKEAALSASKAKLLKDIAREKGLEAGDLSQNVENWLASQMFWYRMRGSLLKPIFKWINQRLL